MMRTRKPQHRPSERGYTAIEVLVAMTLFAIGAAGVIGMQRVSVQGNADARRADVATGIAGQWLARLRRDSLMWTQVDDLTAAPPVTNNRSNTVWLQDSEVTVLAPPVPANFGWKLPKASAIFPGSGNTFDVLGREVVTTSADRFFCVNYRLDWLLINSTIRAEVRVFWPRFEQDKPADCTPATAAVTNAQELFHFVYATTLLRRNAL